MAAAEVSAEAATAGRAHGAASGLGKPPGVGVAVEGPVRARAPGGCSARLRAGCGVGKIEKIPDGIF